MADDYQSRISRIETMWTLVRGAHEPAADGVAQAQEALLQLYSGAIYRYLLGILRDPNAADEVFQEFALKFVRGAFRNADPDRGRFRDFVKRALSNLIHDHRARQRRLPTGLEAESLLESPASEEAMPSDREFVDRWREEILQRTWAALAEEEKGSKQPYHAVLRFRSKHPDMPSGKMAEAMKGELGRLLTDGGIRQILHRAREKFADLLIAEVRRSLVSPDADALREELAELGLLPYCQSALNRSAKEG
jgi:RNA polymerase sigma factor (sigma-70 family)